MPLTDNAIKNAQPHSKAKRLYDAGGLYLEVAPSGSKYWRFKYRFAKREKRLAVGVYPDTGLKLARERRDQARRLLESGVDPSSARRAEKLCQQCSAANSFRLIATEWFETHKGSWTVAHAKKTWSRIEGHMLPWLGSRPIAEITPPEFLSVLQKVAKVGKLETARRVRQIASKIFRHSVVTSRAKLDVTQDLKGAIPAPKVKHLAAITNPSQVGRLLEDIDGYAGTPVVCAALRLAPLVFVRPVELRQARWSEIDLAEKQWAIPGERMKMKKPHIVPLCQQAFAILTELQPITMKSEFVFPGARSLKRPMSENAVNAALRYMGVDGETMCGHGFRAMARTILDEVLKVRVDVIEHQLAHAVVDPNGRAYNRTWHLEDRRRMMQEWADYLDALRIEHLRMRRLAA